MTRDQHIETIRAVCIKANPEIAALPPYPYNPDVAKAIVALEKIAAKTLWNNELEQGATIYIENYRQQQAGDYRAMLEQGWEGRPIRLVDVLLAIGNAFSVDGTGSFFELERVMEDDWIYTVQGTRWNLRQDDLTQQSDECITFLADLLA